MLRITMFDGGDCSVVKRERDSGRNSWQRVVMRRPELKWRDGRIEVVAGVDATCRL
jgi:hypothetical protein